MLYVGPSTLAVARLRSPRAGSILSETRLVQAQQKKKKDTQAWSGSLCGARNREKLRLADWWGTPPNGGGLDKSRKLREIGVGNFR